MESKGTEISFKTWETRGAAVKTSFDTAPIVNEFNARLWQSLSEKGLAPSQAEGPVTLQGRIIRIDEGNRLVRYLMTHAAGHAVLEVEGVLLYEGRKIADLYTKSQSAGLHLFGGAADVLLKNCARQGASAIAKQVVNGINNRDPNAALPADASMGGWSESQRSPRQWAAVCETRIKEGTRAESLVAEMIRDGMPQAQAESMVGNALRSLNKRSWKIIGCSIAMMIFGILATIGGYQTAVETAASTGQGTYFVWFGAVICGVIGLIYGIRSLMRPKAAATDSTPQATSAAPEPLPLVTRSAAVVSTPEKMAPPAGSNDANPFSAQIVPQTTPAAPHTPAQNPYQPSTGQSRISIPGWAWVVIVLIVISCMTITIPAGVGLMSYLASNASKSSAAVHPAPTRFVVATKTMAAFVPPPPVVTDTPPVAGVAVSKETQPAKPRANQLPGSSLPVMAGAISPQNVAKVSIQAHTENDPNQPPLICNQVAWFPDNQRIAVASNEVHIYDFRTAKEEMTTTGLQWVNGLAVYPDGKTMALSSGSAGILLWDVTANTETRVLSQEQNSSQSMALSPDGKRLAATTQNGFSLYDVETGQKLQDVANVNGPYKIIFSPDGSMLAGTGAELKLWDAADGRMLRTFPSNVGGVNSVAFSPDGKTLASAWSDQSIKVWDIATGAEIVTLTGHTNMIDQVNYSPDGRLMASIGRDKVVRLWDMSSGKEVRSLPYEADITSDVRFSPDGTMIAACGINAPLTIWGLPNSKASQPTATWAPPTPVVAAADAPVIAKKSQLDLRMGSKGLIWAGENRILIGGYGIVLYNPLDNTQASLGAQEWVFNIALSPDGNTLASTSFEAIKLTTLDSQAEKTLGKAEPNSVLAFSPDGSTVAASINQAVKLYDVSTGNELNTIPTQTYAQKLAFTPDGKSLVVVSGYNIVFFDIASGSASTTLKGHIQSPNTLAFSPDGKIMAVGGSDGSNDGKVVFWDVASGQWMRTMTGHTNRVTALAFSPDGRWLVTGSADLTLRVWDVASGTLLNTLTGHTSGINSISFAPDQTALVSGGDQEVIIWSIMPKK